MISFRQIFRRSQIHDDLAEEIQQHLAEEIDSLMAGGMNRRDAEFAARRRFGNVTLIEEQGSEAWRMPNIEGWLSDLKFALRRLKASPGFALTAVITLALGIGANVVVFSVLNGLILRPLGVPDAKNLYQISHGKNGGDWQSYPDYKDFRDRDPSFSGIMAYKFFTAGMSIDNATVRGWGFAATGNYFDVLGVQPALGHFFHASDEHGLGSAPYVVLSYDFWRRQFGARPDVLGKAVKLNGHPFTVIGVAEQHFRGTEVYFWPDYWMPVVNAEQVTGWSDFCCRDHIGFVIMGRLKQGITPQQATESLNALAARMAREDKKDDGLSLRLRQPGPAGDENDPTKKGLLGIMLLAGLVLLAACANLASIFAARAADRAGELAVRLAIGASRWIVLRQLLTEAVLISIMGGLLGSLFAWQLLQSLSSWRPFGDFPIRLLVVPDAAVYLVAIGLSLASGVFFGLLPARQVWRTDVVQAIKTGYVWMESFRRFAMRDVLLVIQIVVCTLLVTASAVAIRGMARAMHVPLGFNPQGVTVAQTDLNMAGYTSDSALPVQRRILEQAQAMPGVTSATMSDNMPFSNGGGQWFVYRWGTTDFVPAHMAFAAITFQVAPGYLQTVQTPLVAGRDFTWHDDRNAPNVAIVNQTFARMLYGKSSPIGQRFALWATAKYQIVGEVEDGKYHSVGEKPEPMMMMPLAQGVGGNMSTAATLLVRSRLPQDQVASALHRMLSREVPGTPFTERSWSDSVDLSLIPMRAITMVLAVMGLLAAVLAMTGIFGMASYSVAKRLKEQGIRIALGARRPQVMRAVLGRPLLLLVGGSILGLAAGLLTGGVIARFGSLATPSDPLVMFSVCLAMILIGVVAAWIPARRMLAIDPAQLLREA
jgi:predicted permease